MSKPSLAKIREFKDAGTEVEVEPEGSAPVRGRIESIAISVQAHHRYQRFGGHVMTFPLERVISVKPVGEEPTS